MADNIQRSVGRPQEYTFDRGGAIAEMGPYIGIVVNNVDNTRQGRLQVWIEQFGKVNSDGSPNVEDPTVWRTVRYISPFYGATKQSGATGVGTYPGNRNSYGMWFTPPDLGTKVLCFFVSGDPTVGGYYVGCIPEDGLNHMIPAIGAASNYQANNATQQQLLKDVTSAPVTEINDIDPKFTDSPKFFDQKKPVQSTVEGILYQQGLNKDPVRGPIKSSAQRESPSNCYGISTPGKPIYQGGYNDKTFKTALEKGQVKLQDIAIIGRQGGHTFVMDDGDINGKDTLVRIRTAKGHQITMSDDGDAFFITHANGQTWLEFGKAGTIDMYSSNSINLRTQGVLNFHADKGINMYSGGTMRIKSKKTAIIDSSESLLLNSEKYTLLSGTQAIGVRSDGTVSLEGKAGSWKSSSTINLGAKLINLNGAQTTPVAKMPAVPNLKLADTEYVAGKGWVPKPQALETIVTRAPTHEPFAGHGTGADVSINLNPITVAAPSNAVADIFGKVETLPVNNGIDLEALSKEQASLATIGSLSTGQVTGLTAQAAKAQSSKYPAYSADGNLMPGFELNENNDPVYTGPNLATVGVGKYGQSVDGLVSTGFLKSAVPDLIKNGISVDSVLKSASSWTNQFGIGGLSDYLNSPALQNITQIGLMTAAFTGLVNSGVFQGTESPKVVATILQPATEFGVDPVVSWVDGFADTQAVVDYEITARQGQYAVDFVDQYTEEVNLIDTATNLPEREEIDQAVAEIIGDPKVPVPQYTDTPTEYADPAIAAAIAAGIPNVTSVENVLQPDGSIIRVPVTKISTTAEDGTFRFAPGAKQG